MKKKKVKPKYLSGTTLTYSEFIFHCAKTIFYIFLISFIISGCSKKEPAKICKTCTVTAVTIGTNQYGLTSIESQDEYCNGETDTITQGMIYQKKISQNGTWSETTKTRTCK